MTAIAQESIRPMLYGEVWHSARTLKRRLKNEISELRHALAKMEHAVLGGEPVSDDLWSGCMPIESEEALSTRLSQDEEQQSAHQHTVVIYRNMIRQRERMYYAIR